MLRNSINMSVGNFDINMLQTKKPKIKIMKTQPSVHEERKVLISVGPNNCQSPMFQNVKLWKYGDIFCYHENIWQTNPNLEKIAYLWIDSERAFESFKEHIGDVYYIIARKEFIAKHNILDKKNEWKLSGILPLEDLIQYHELYYMSVKEDLKKGEFNPSSIIYSLALTYNKNYIYHFENVELSPPPEHYHIFGETNIYSFKNPEHIEEFKKYFAPIYLFQQYYIPKDSNRRKEINYCMKKNIKSGFFDKIIMLNEKIYDKYDLNELQDPCVQQFNINRRMTYQDVINITKTSLPKYCYVIIANSDIYFDETLFSMFNIKLDKTLLALLRFDLLGDLYDKNYQQKNIFGPRADSQDVWIFKKQSGLPEDAGFSLGVNGCDNAIASCFFKKKFRILNPSFNIQTIHVHMSEIRTYDKRRIQYYPFYTHIKPHGIRQKEHIKPDENMVVYESPESKSYSQLYPHYSQEIRTFMTYAKKKHKFAPEFQQNTNSDSYVYNRIYRFHNMSCNNAGSIYNKNIQYTLLGDNVNEVSNMQIKRICVCQKAIMIPQYGDDMSDNPKGLFWFLKNSLPKMLVMSQTTVANEAFIANIDNTLVQYLQKINVLLKFVKASKNVDIFARELFVPQPIQELNYPREYINLIRKHYRVNDDAKENNNLVVLVRNMDFYDTQESWDEFQNEVTKKINETIREDLRYVVIEDRKENYVSSMEMFKQALIVIGYRCEIMANCIFTPKNAAIFEIAFESTPDLQLWNLSAAAEHNYTLVSHKREPKSRQLFMILKKLKMAIDTMPWNYKPYAPQLETFKIDDSPDNVFIEKEEYRLNIKIRQNIKDSIKIRNFASFIRECENDGLLGANTIEYVDTIVDNDNNQEKLIEFDYAENTCVGGLEMIDSIFNITDLSGLSHHKCVETDDKINNVVLTTDIPSLRDNQFVYFDTLDENRLIELLTCFTLGTVPIITKKVEEFLQNLDRIQLVPMKNYIIHNNCEETPNKIILPNKNIIQYIRSNNNLLYNSSLSQVAILSDIKDIIKQKQN